MKYLSRCKLNCIFTTIIILAGFSSFSQNKTMKDFKDSTGFVAYVVNKGDTVAIHSDSTIMVNRNTFNVYKTYRAKLNAENSSFKDIVTVYERIISKQDTMLKVKEDYYKELSSRFDSLTGRTHLFLDQTSSNIKIASSSLDDATRKLETTQKLLADTQKLLQAERRRINGKAIKFGLVGFVVGGLLAAVIIH